MAPGQIAFVTVSFEHNSHLVRDQFVNTFTFQAAADDTLVSESDVVAQLSRFYHNAASGTGITPSARMSPCIDRTTPATLRFYDITAHLGGTPVGSPYHIDVLTSGGSPASSGTPLPSEVCICLSFHSAYGADVEFAPGARPRARDRGRIYFGPLNIDVISLDANGSARPHSQMKDTLNQAANTLRDNLDAAGVRWTTWSRRNAAVWPVTDCWTDDAFDTQRRRGERPTSKSILHIAP